MNGYKKSGFSAILLLVIIFIAEASPLFARTAMPALKSGTWRGVLHRPDDANIAFNFTVANQNGKPVLYIHNGSENLLVDSIKQSSDSLFIQMPFFASRFALQIKQDGSLTGNYIKNYGSTVMSIPFTAVYGAAYRYQTTSKPTQNITGNWQVTFAGEDSVSSNIIGEFAQQKNGVVTGTFRTSTGDYRYLEGRLNGDTLLLSGFDGGHAILFTASLHGNVLSNGVMYSGLTAKSLWSAVKNNNAKLPDSYGLTKMRAGETGFSFRFPSTNGDLISISDERYKNKVVVVQILGSWCPNCMDETSFLSTYYNKNKSRGIEVIGLAYERTTDFAESKESLQPFQKRFGVQYPFLVTGVSVSDEQKTEKTLPQLTNIQAFPTTIFINKKGEVDKIHTGYDGPATGVHFEEFKAEFESEIDKLLKE